MLATYKISGPIPEQIGNLVKLTSLDLTGNHLDGTIPCSISKLTAIEDMRLDRNNFDFICKNISALMNLRELRLEVNNISGSFPYVDSKVNTIASP